MRYFNPGFLCIFYCIFLMSGSVSADSLEVNYFTPTNLHRFADYLFDEADYNRAVGEFQRYLFSFDSIPSNADSIFYKIGLCYRANGHYKRSIDYFNKIIGNHPQSYLLDKAYYQVGLSYFFMDRFKESNIFLNSCFSGVKQRDIKVNVEQLIAINYIQQKEWNETIDFLSEQKSTDSISIHLANFAKEGQLLPRKSELLAGLFSTVAPGAGKFYCNRPIDGLHSFISVGFTGWQAYEGFHKDGIHSVKGWIFGVLGGIFYLGNIYGSVVVAQIYNEQQEEDFLNKVKVYVNVNFH